MAHAYEGGDYGGHQNGGLEMMGDVGGHGEGSAVFVSNLQWWTTDAELEALCARYGRVASLRFLDDKSCGKSRGMAIVEFVEGEAAAACITGLNGRDINGRSCRVNQQQNRSDRPGGSSQFGAGRGGAGRGGAGRGRGVGERGGRGEGGGGGDLVGGGGMLGGGMVPPGVIMMPGMMGMGMPGMDAAMLQQMQNGMVVVPGMMPGMMMPGMPGMPGFKPPPPPGAPPPKMG